MRKITENAVNAFLNNENFSKSNTSVHVLENSNMVELRLHNNTIMRKIKGNIFISNAGWFTNTTKERLNGLGYHLGFSIRQDNFNWYIGDKQWDGQWTRVYAI